MLRSVNMFIKRIWMSNYCALPRIRFRYVDDNDLAMMGVDWNDAREIASNRAISYGDKKLSYRR